MGMEDLDTLKKNLKERIQQDFDSAARMKLKDSLLDILEKKHKFELPESMVNQNLIKCGTNFNNSWNNKRKN